MSANEVTRQWFDKLEQVLHADADLAGLLGHGTLIGDAREFFVSRILRSVLPPALHVGTGKVIASDGTQSNQIDVIIYDPQFPLMEAQPGQGLYLLEGVIATIEVKSELTGEKLRQALDNCWSVNRMESWTHHEPQTYVFAFRTPLTIETLANHTRKWWDDTDDSLATDDRLPAIVVAGDVIGIGSGKVFRIDATDRPDDLGAEAIVGLGFLECTAPLRMAANPFACDLFAAPSVRTMQNRR